MRTVFEPPRSGGADYALIDFSTNSLASAFIVDNHLPFTDDHPEPQKPSAGSVFPAVSIAVKSRPAKGKTNT